MTDPQPAPPVSASSPPPVPISRAGFTPPPPPTNRQWAALLALCVIACVARLSVVRSTPAIDPAYHGTTSQLYIDVAQAFLNGNGWTWNGMPATQHPPGYSLYLAAALWLGGAKGLLLARVGQALLDAMVCVLVWSVARRFAPLWAAWLAAAAFALLPEFVFSPAAVLADGMVTVWMALAVLAACRWAESGRARWAAALGLGAGLAMLWRSECLLLAPAAILWAGVAVKSPRRAVVGVATCALVIAGLFGPWVAWSRHATAGVDVGAAGWSNTMLSGLAQRPNRYGLLSSDRFTGAIAYGRGLEWHTAAANNAFTEIALDVVARDPWLPVRATVARQTLILTGANLPWPAHDIRRLAQRGVFGLAVGLGIFAIAAGRIRWWPAALVSAPLLMYCGSLGLLWYEPRFVVPGHLSLLWLAAAAFASAAVPRRLWVWGVVSGVVLACAGGAAWEWRTNELVRARLEADVSNAPWVPVGPESWEGARLRRGSAEEGFAVEIVGPTGTAAAPGFVVASPAIPTVPGLVGTVLVDLEVTRGAVRLGLVQTIQFPQQPPEQLWLAEVGIGASGRYTVLLPVQNFTGRPIRVVLLPAPLDSDTTPAGDVVCRVIRLAAWPAEPGPTRPVVVRRTAPSD